ncbi:hypothetical protein [Nocardioides sp. Root151]|uniref:hypothetical protein n=1 Tax=Nocardioides sp. Root151 TaxID=1736475 RepID=UPI00070274CC|nr:hypothetical protein [Nocardioides sp. Root151]KQZ66848.1 hypothetical protein ASD66_17645 [Nocardioides sp. Root151]
MSRRRVALFTVVVVVIAAVAAAVGWFVWPRDSDFEKAAALLPDDTLRVTWTDWERVRDEVGDSDVYTAATDRDLSVSSLAGSADDIEAQLGFDPLDADWELLGQSREGMVVVVKLPGDLDDVASAFKGAGYTEPSSKRMDGAVWEGGPDVLASLGLTNNELQSVAFVEEEGLLVGSDSATYLRSAMKTVTGDEDGLDVTPLTDPLEDDPLDATVFLEDYACEALSMSQADEATQTVADGLVDDAGGVSPLKGYLVALSADEQLSVVFRFADDDQAERNASSRGSLATAEDPGQMVAYSDVFSDPTTEADDADVVLTATALRDGYPMANLAAGPVLLATC